MLLELGWNTENPIKGELLAIIQALTNRNNSERLQSIQLSRLVIAIRVRPPAYNVYTAVRRLLLKLDSSQSTLVDQSTNPSLCAP